MLTRRGFEVIVLAVPTAAEIAAAVEARVNAIVDPASAELDVRLRTFGPSQLQ